MGLEVLPGDVLGQVLPVDAFQRGKEVHLQKVQEAGPRAGGKIFLKEVPPLAVGGAEIKEELEVALLQEDLVPPYFLHPAVEGEPGHQGPGFFALERSLGPSFSSTTRSSILTPPQPGI